MEQLLTEIEAFMEVQNFSATRFGDEALGDRHFVRQLREGRDIRLSTVERVREFMANYEPGVRAA